MLIPGIVSATFKTKSTDEVIAITKNAGLKAIEWSENHHIVKGDIEEAKRVADKTILSGLEIAGYGSYYRLGQGMDIKESLETAKAMGTDQMRIWAGSKPSSETSKDERDALVKELKEAVKEAESYGITLNLEWHKNTLTDTNLSGKETLDALSSFYLHTLWQPTQALSFKERVEGLVIIMPYLSYLHVYYWDESGRRPLDEGVTCWRKYFSVLPKEKKYYALLEFVKGDSVEQFYKDAATLLRLL